MLLARTTARPLLRTRANPTSRYISTSSSLLDSFRFQVATSIHGKPGSPIYRPPGAEEPEDSDNSGRPDWRGQNQAGRLQQGLAADHPCSLWRDTELAKMATPGGASSGHDWFYVEEQPDGEGVSLGIADGVGGWEESGEAPSARREGPSSPACPQASTRAISVKR